MDLCNWKFHWERTITARQQKVHKPFHIWVSTAIAGSLLATQCEELRHPSFRWCQYCSCSFVERPPLVVAAMLPLLLPGALWIDSRPRGCWKAETWILGLCAPCISYTVYIYIFVFQCVCVYIYYCVYIYTELYRHMRFECVVTPSPNWMAGHARMHKQDYLCCSASRTLKVGTPTKLVPWSQLEEKRQLE